MDRLSVCLLCSLSKLAGNHKCFHLSTDPKEKEKDRRAKDPVPRYPLVVPEENEKLGSITYEAFRCVVSLCDRKCDILMSLFSG